MSSTPPTSRPGRRSLFQVSGWPLRRKLALALTIPLLLAATLGGLRVHSDLTEASNSSATSDQVTVLRPAVDYLSIAERAMVAAQSDSTSNKAALADAVGGPPDGRRGADRHGRDRRAHPGAEQPGRRGAGPQPLPARGGYRDAQPGHLGGPAAPAPVRHDAARQHHRQRPDRPRAPPGAAGPDAERTLLPGHAAGTGRHRPLRRHRLPGALLRARRRGRGHRPSGRRPRVLRAGRRGPAHRERPALPRDPHRRHRPRWSRRVHAVRQPRRRH